MKAPRTVQTALVPAPLLTLAIIAAALYRQPAYFAQPGAARFLLYAVFPLCAYAVLPLVVFVRLRLSPRPAFRVATIAGCLLSIVDTAGVCLENGFPITVHSFFLRSIPTLTVFLGWGLVAFWWVRRSGHQQLPAGHPIPHTLREAIGASVWTATISMLFTIAASSLFELILRPPAPSYVALWGEYQRSGWQNPGLFALANTFDSITSHLLLAPVVALILGSIGALAASATLRFGPSRPASSHLSPTDPQTKPQLPGPPSHLRSAESLGLSHV